MDTNTNIEKSSKEDFFDWAYDTRHYESRNNKIAWTFAAFFAALSVLSIAALVGLTPIKEKIPFVFTVDKNTGIVELRTMSDTLNWTPTEAEDYANVAKYVQLRASYLRATYPQQYEKAVKMSAKVARRDLIESYAPNAPKSPILLYRERSQVDIRFKSVAYHGSNNNVVIARYIADIKSPEGTVSKHYIATVQYEYADNASLSLSARIFNPHAFVATNYQISEEGFQN